MTALSAERSFGKNHQMTAPGPMRPFSKCANSINSSGYQGYWKATRSASQASTSDTVTTEAAVEIRIVAETRCGATP